MLRLVPVSAGIPTRLVQLEHPDEGRRAALVYENELHLLATYRSLYSFAQAAIETGWRLRDLLSTDLSGIVLDYEKVYRLETPWRFRPCFDYPEEPGRCLVSSAADSGPRHGSFLALPRLRRQPARTWVIRFLPPDRPTLPPRI